MPQGALHCANHVCRYCAVLIYSTVNVKELTDYDPIVRYSCEVTG